MTLYENPGVSENASQPGVLRPAGELQVTNEPLASAHAQAFIAALNGQNGDQTYAAWPRTQVTLKNGEQVVVVPDRFDSDGPMTTGFSVLTATTLVHVSDDLEITAISALAARLRPLR